MPLTRSVNATVRERATRDPAFRAALFSEAAQALLAGDLDEAKAALRAYPLKAVGPGVRELRIRDRTGAFRVIYLAALPDRIVVLHAFQKKTQRTAPRDIALAAKRFRELRKD